MISLFLLGLSSFCLSLILTPVCRDVFLALGVVDVPDDYRKNHKQPIARVGGVAIALAYLAAFILLFFSPVRNEVLKKEHLPFILKLLPAGLLMLATGLLDDLLNLKPWQKLFGQFAAAGWAYWAGVRIAAFGGHSTAEWWWSVPLTLLWLVACTNAFNFIDGVDGLAAGLGFFATVTTLVAALLQNNIYLAVATVPLAGCLLGFLRFNFHPASIFLGDSGSLLIGFLLGCYGVIWGQKSATLLGMIAPLMVLAVPMLDVCLSIVRRFIRKKPIFSGDRGHIHHQLLDRGLGPRGVVLILYGVTGLAAVFSLLQSVYHNQYYAPLIIILFCSIASVGIRNLNYIEFDVVRRLLFGGDLTTMLNARLFLRNFEQALTAANTIEQCRRAIEDACRELGFSQLKMRLAGQVYECHLAAGDPDTQYEVFVPLVASDYIDLKRNFFCAAHPTIISSFIDALRTHLNGKFGNDRIPASAGVDSEAEIVSVAG